MKRWCILILSMLCGRAFAADPEIRATWLTTTNNDAIASPENTARTMRALREIGLNTVYVECWKNGYTEFPSEVMRRAIGVSYRVNGQGAVQRDLLAECIAQAHRNHLTCIAWFEYGFMAAFKDTHNELRAKHEWLSLDQDGNEIEKNGFVWMNPLRPECQDLLIGIVMEAVKKYDLDGVQLDDRLAWPGLEMGYDDYTKRIYAAEHDGAQPPTDVKDREWMRWRTEKITAFAHRFVRQVRSAKPDVILSLSPGPAPWARENYMCDWPAWEGWDEFVPQCYRMDHAGFATCWNDQLKAAGQQKRNLIAGIRLIGDGPDQPPGDATRSIELIRSSGAAGHSWWFSKAVLGSYKQEISAIYDVSHNGYAERPNQKRPHLPGGQSSNP